MQKCAIETATPIVQCEEGFEPKPYYCPTGFITIGNGQKLFSLSKDEIKKQYGNSDKFLKNFCCQVTKKSAAVDLKEKLTEIRHRLVAESWYVNLDSEKQAIIISMAYQLGITGLFKFKNMIKALKAKDYKMAQIEALDSRWAKQTKSRAKKHANILGGGTIKHQYPDIQGD